MSAQYAYPVQWRASGLWPRIEAILRDPSTDVF